MLSEFPTKHASCSPVTFVTLKQFACRPLLSAILLRKLTITTFTGLKNVYAAETENILLMVLSSCL